MQLLEAAAIATAGVNVGFAIGVWWGHTWERANRRIREGEGPSSGSDPR